MDLYCATLKIVALLRFILKMAFLQKAFIELFPEKDLPEIKVKYTDKFEPYNANFNKKTKAKIKKRDGHLCQNPFCWKVTNRLIAHHVDYDKQNCSDMNIITLCFSCNSRANFNRQYWKRLFRNILFKKFIVPLIGREKIVVNF